MERNRPKGRKVTHSGGSGVEKTGSGLGGGKVGSGGFFDSGQSGSSGGGFDGGKTGNSGGGFLRSAGGKISILAVLAALLFGGGGMAVSNMGDSVDYQETLQQGGGTYSGWSTQDNSTGNTGVLNTDVSEEARDKFTIIKGGGKDKVTILVYMCGTDLESRSAMATNDLNEMISATIGNNVDVIVYTGGCKSWRNSLISSGRNQIWHIKNGNIKNLIDNGGNGSMTDPETLSSFIKWGAEKFPANRTSLIFWDHGGGSISGYGYDEKYPRSGSMPISGIDKALKQAGIRFDFIGFDTCLMATAETALVAGKYADYMIGSEETEPGIGWYYTNWLTALSNDTGMPTLEIGRMIADDFTKQCAKRCPGQSTTLSVTDLAELTQTLPSKLNDFAEEAAAKISGGEYKEVAVARSSSKEFARGTNIDQVDLIHFASLTNSSTGKKLAETVAEAVKYNVTSRNTKNAYGLSIYFPYRTLNKVDSISNTYAQIGMDEGYADCIRKFAQMETCGQAVSQGGGNPFSPLFNWNPDSPDMTTQAMQQLLSSLLSGGFTDGRSLGIEGLDKSNTGYMSKDPLDPEVVTDYISNNRITAKDLEWKKNDRGQDAIVLTDEQWELIETADLNMYYDDGEGYIELGLDNVFDFDDDGNLLPHADRSWLSINGQPVAYYHTETTEDGDKYCINGYVPILLNGQRARLMLTFTDENEEGAISGVSTEYDEEVTETEGKSLAGLKKGDKVEFVCDYYSRDKKYEDSYKLGRTWTVEDPANVKITNSDVGKGNAIYAYKFTDIYGEEYWTPVNTL